MHREVGPRGRPAGGGRRVARWPAALAVAAILLLYTTLPDRLTLGPTWPLPVLALALLVPLVVAVPSPGGAVPGWRRLLLSALPQRQEEAPRWQWLAVLALIALVNAANVGSLGLLLYYLLHGTKAEGEELLIAATKIWLTNVLVFALWYWALDRGGPGARARSTPGEPDLLFPQMTRPAAAAAAWAPGFVDYLYLSFTNATAFSPTDTLPLTAWAKLLMLVQSLASLLTVALVAARAVNILN